MLSDLLQDRTTVGAHGNRDSRTASSAKIIAVASGKGGVGKTWMSISLAALLASFGKRVLVFDADFGLANIDIQLGMVPTLDISDYLCRDRTLQDVIQTATIERSHKRDEIKIDVLPGCSGASFMSRLTERDIDPILFELRNMNNYDVVIVDLCASINDMTRHVSSISDLLLAVTTEEPTALADVYAVIKLYIKDRRRLLGQEGACQVIINQAASHRSGEQTFRKLSQACKTFLSWSPELAGVVRKDSRVPSSIRRQQLLMIESPTSPSWLDATRIARGLLNR